MKVSSNMQKGYGKTTNKDFVKGEGTQEKGGE